MAWMNENLHRQNYESIRLLFETNLASLHLRDEFVEYNTAGNKVNYQTYSTGHTQLIKTEMCCFFGGADRSVYDKA